MVASIKTLNFMSATVYESIFKKKRNIPILKTSIYSKHLRDYRLIDVMLGSAKPYKYKSTKVYQIDRCNQHSNKQKFPCFDDAIMQEEL